MSDKKMLILRGKSDNTGKVYPDEQGNFIKWPKGALHEEAAKEYARRKGYEPVVLDVEGETGPGSAQTSQALIMLRDKDGDDFKALYGFSGGGYNVRWILSALKKDERARFELIVVLGAPPTVFKDGKFVYSPTGSPQKSDFLKSSFEGGRLGIGLPSFYPGYLQDAERGRWTHVPPGVAACVGTVHATHVEKASVPFGRAGTLAQTSGIKGPPFLADLKAYSP